LPLFLVIRTLLCLFVVRNYDHPDEYWQGAEIAHKIFYGYGYETWEWTS
jgi:phosphatidylinositol glycan class B